MGTVSVSLPSDGQTIDAADYNTPINTIVSEINGNLDNSNIASDAAIDRSKISGFTDGWESLGDTPDTVTYNGNRSYDLVFNSTDLTGDVSNGMRLKLTRTVTAPTQCTDLESGSSQYWSKTSPAGLSFTDTYTCMAWVKLESYTRGGIIARRNADTEGWSMQVNVSGQLELYGLRIAANNRQVVTYQSLPLNKWVHVAASITMSTGVATTYFDGVSVPNSVTTNGTATAIVQGTTALVVGAEKSAGTNPFDGKIAQAAVFSSVLSAATIASYASQTLSGAESTNVACFKFNGDANDSNANANNLSANGSATATATDTPFAGGATGTTEYGIITANTFSTDTTLTVQVPEGYAIPTSGGVSAVSYSTQAIPYGFVADRSKWVVGSYYRVQQTEKTNTTYAQFYGDQLIVPTGSWRMVARIPFYASASATGTAADYAISTSTSAVDSGDGTANIRINNDPAVLARANYEIVKYLQPTTATTYYGIGKTGNAAVSYGYDGDDLIANITVELLYV